MSLFGTLFGAALNAGFGALQNEWAAERTAQDRRENYRYGEMAADNADKRTRALYAELQSPAALMQQYKEAGLSPSVMSAGAGAGGMSSGAHGTGAAGPSTPYMPMSLLEGAQIANINAQTEKTKAETSNISKDTELKEIERIISEMTKTNKETAFRILNTHIVDDNGEEVTLYNKAQQYNTYEDFDKYVRSIMPGGTADTEEAQQTIRKIYYNAQRFETDIDILSAEDISAKFQKSVIDTLNKQGFANQNAKTCIAQLKAAAETADLTQQQKGAWNNLLEKLEKKNATAKDIVIVAGMILSNYMHGSGIQVNTGDSYFVKNDK